MIPSNVMVRCLVCGELHPITDCMVTTDGEFAGIDCLEPVNTW